MPLAADDLRDRARRLRLLLLDVDGVLTDGTVSIDASSGEYKSFYIRDGAAILWARRHGLDVGLLSGRPSPVTTRRAAELGLTIVSQGAAGRKHEAFAGILADHGFAAADVAYMADDVLDLPVLRRAGLSAAPADAVDEVRTRVDWVSRFPGGRGAVRELIEVLLAARGQWDAVMKEYSGDGT